MESISPWVWILVAVLVAGVYGWVIATGDEKRAREAEKVRLELERAGSLEYMKGNEP